MLHPTDKPDRRITVSSGGFMAHKLLIDRVARLRARPPVQRGAAQQFRFLASLIAVVVLLVPAVTGVRSAWAVPASDPADNTDKADKPEKPDKNSVTIDAQVGLNDGYLFGLIDPLVVTLRSRVLIRGTVRVKSGFNAVTVAEVPVEIPSNTELRLVVPVSGGVSTGDMSVSFDVGRTPFATTAVAAQGVSGESVVVLTGAQPKIFERTADIGGSVTLKITKGTADDLERSPILLESVSVLALRADELNAFSPRLRNALLRWVRSGGEVLIDDKPGTPVAILEGIRAVDDKGLSANVVLGDGDFRFTSGMVRQGKWQSFAAFTDRGQYNDQQTFGNGSLGGNLGVLNGQKLVQLNSLMLGLVGYVALIGPILFFMLKRSRKLVASWIIIPLVAMTTAGGVVAYGLSKRKAGTEAAVSIVDVGAGGGRALSTVLLRSIDGTTKHTKLQPEWHLSLSSLDNGGDFFGQSSERQGGAPEISSSIQAGGAVLTTARGPLEKSLNVIVRAQIKNNAIEVVVKNPNSTKLEQVEVYTVSGKQEVGDLAGGESKTITIGQNPDASTALGQHGNTHIEFNNDEFSGSEKTQQNPDWTFLRGWNGIERGPVQWGTVEVTGWARDQASPFISSARGWHAVTRRVQLTPAAPNQRGTGEIRRIVRNLNGGLLVRFDVDTATDTVIYDGEIAQLWNGSDWVIVNAGPLKVPPSGMILMRALQRTWSPMLRTPKGKTDSVVSINDGGLENPDSFSLDLPEIFDQPEIVTPDLLAPGALDGPITPIAPLSSTIPDAIAAPADRAPATTAPDPDLVPPDGAAVDTQGSGS
jgi:hypothetical protein